MSRDGEREMEEHRRRVEEYTRRLVPASDEEIIALAETLWADPKFKAIFERVGYEGDMTDEEEAAVRAEIDAYRQGSMWDRDELHLALAPSLVRRLAAGMIDRLDGPEARQYLDDRKVERAGPLVKSEDSTAEQVMSFARAMKSDPACWAVIMRLKDYPDLFVYEVDKEGVLNRFTISYKFKYGLFNQPSIDHAIGLLRSIAAGNIADLDHPDAWEVLKRDQSIN